jgi:hypothetical protein
MESQSLSEPIQILALSKSVYNGSRHLKSIYHFRLIQINLDKEYPLTLNILF